MSQKISILFIWQWKKIVLLSPNEREQMGIEGRKKMVNTFDETFVIRDYITTLKEALNSF